MDAVAVALAGPDTGQVAVPVVARPLLQLVPQLEAVLAEQAELDTLGMLGEEREACSLTVPRRTERERTTGPDAYWPSGTSQSTESGGRVSSAENGWPCQGSSSAVMLSFCPALQPA